MLGAAQFRGAAIDLGARVDKQRGFQHVAALVALVASRALISADITGAFNVTIRQEPLLVGGVPLVLAFLVQVAIALQGGEDTLRDAGVILGVGTGEQVIGQSQLLKELNEASMKALIHLVRGAILRVCAHSNGRAMTV